MEWIRTSDRLPTYGKKVLIMWYCPEGNRYPYTDTAELTHTLTGIKGTKQIWSFSRCGTITPLNKEDGSKELVVGWWMELPDRPNTLY